MGGLDFRFYDSSDFKTYLLMRWFGPDALAFVRPTGVYTLDFFALLLSPYLCFISVSYLDLDTWGRLDLAVLFTPSTPNRQNGNQVRWNTCAGVRGSTPSHEVVKTEQSRDLFQKIWRITACMRGNILDRLINSGVFQSAQFYLCRWLFWRTPSTLNIAKSSLPLIIAVFLTLSITNGIVSTKIYDKWDVFKIVIS